MSIASEITRLQGAKSDLKDAIEGKGVTVPSATKLDGYADLVDAISQGGGTLGTKTITSNGTYNASSDGYDGYSKVTANVSNTYTQSDEGKVVSNGALVAQTAHADVTPTTSDQTIDTTTNNSLKVKGDANLVAGNIKKDVEIFGITGSYEGGGGDIITQLQSLTELVSDATFDIPQYWLQLGSVQRVYLPNATKTGQYGTQNSFRALSSLKSLVLPSLVNVGEDTINGSDSLAKIDLRDVTRIYARSLRNASSFNMLVIRASSVPPLSNVSAFDGTPFASSGAGGTLYVPQSLISSYQSASNWSTILGYANNQIKSIESTHTDPTAPIDLTLYYADGTPLPT